MVPLASVSLLFLVAAAVAVQTPDNIKQCFHAQGASRPHRDVSEATMKAVVADKLEYLHEFHSGYNVFHIGKDKTTQKECAFEVAELASSSILSNGARMLQAVAGVKGFPTVIVSETPKKLDTKYYKFYATSKPGPIFLSLLLANLVTLQQAQRWLYQLTNAVIALHTKLAPPKDKNAKNAPKEYHIYNGLFLYNVYLNLETQSEIQLRPDATPAVTHDEREKLKDLDNLFHFIRFVLGVWMHEATVARFPNGAADMEKELAEVFPQPRTVKSLATINEVFPKLLTEGHGGKNAWFIGWNAADATKLSSWTPQTPIVDVNQVCIVGAYNAA